MDKIYAILIVLSALNLIIFIAIGFFLKKLIDIFAMSPLGGDAMEEKNSIPKRFQAVFKGEKPRRRPIAIDDQRAIQIEKENATMREIPIS